MKDQELTRLRTLTEALKQIAGQCLDQFVNRTSEADYEVDFYGTVKPFADNVTDILTEWKPLVLEWIKTAKPSYVFLPQVLDAEENLTIVSVTAFQKDTRRKRYLNTISAIEHTMSTILSQIDLRTR